MIEQMSYKELVRAARELVFRNTGLVLPEKELIEYVKDLSNSAPSESQSVVDNESAKDACKHVWPLSPSKDGYYYCVECNEKWHQQAD